MMALYVGMTREGNGSRTRLWSELQVSGRATLFVIGGADNVLQVVLPAGR